MKKALPIVLLIGLLVAGFLWRDSRPPVIEWVEASKAVGPESEISVRFSDEGLGLARIEATLHQGDRESTVLEERLSAPWFPWNRGTGARRVTLRATDLGELDEGDFSLEVRVRDGANWGLFSRETTDTRQMLFDKTPPRLGLVSSDHHVFQGGAEAVVYTVSDDTTQSGVKVGETLFKGSGLARRGEQHRVAILAFPYDGGDDVPLTLWAVDEAGNQSRLNLPISVHKRAFRRRDIRITKNFIEKTAPEILSRSGLERPPDDKATFLLVNDRLRRENHEAIKEVAAQSATERLWDEPFVQLSNSQVEASFADHRRYLFEGEEIDRQTHLGFDLASVATSPVEAANRGRVVFADYLGIYGNCVLLDHGLGVLSLYAHLSSIEVALSQMVDRGQALGRTGQTGLAAGDHLHFTLLVQGHPVNPLEWWDPDWIRNRILNRLGER